jgi:hypothetical protein
LIHGKIPGWSGLSGWLRRVRQRAGREGAITNLEEEKRNEREIRIEYGYTQRGHRADK